MRLKFTKIAKTILIISNKHIKFNLINSKKYEHHLVSQTLQRFDY